MSRFAAAAGRLGALAVTGALACGCSAAAPPSATELPPVRLPEISALAAPVQGQIRGRYDALEQMLSEPNASAADRASAYGELGQILEAAKFNEDAATCYAHAQALAPDDARWPYALGHVYLGRGERARAAEAFERAATLRPTEPAPLIRLAETYLDQGRLELAQSTFGRAVSIRPDAAALFGAGRTALARRAYPEAVQYLERALMIDPQASAVHYPLAMAHRAAGDATKAEAHLKQRGERWPDLVDPLRLRGGELLESPVAYEHRGVDALQRQDWPAAAVAFRKGLEIDPADATLRHWLGATLYAAGDAAAAEREFREVVRRSPDFAKAHFSLGAIFAARGQQAAAIEAYSAAVRSDPTLIEARLRLGDALRGAGKLDASFEQYSRAAALNPAMAEAWLGGAHALVALRRYQDARDWIGQARRLHPARADLADLERRLPQ